MLAANDEPDFMEPCYSAATLAKRWGLGESTVLAMAKAEPDIIVIKHKLSKNRKRAYTSVRIPESVARRMWAKLRQS